MAEEVKIDIAATSDPTPANVMSAALDKLAQEAKNASVETDKLKNASQNGNDKLNDANKTLNQSQSAASMAASSFSQVASSINATGPAARVFQGSMQTVAIGIQALRTGVMGLVGVIVTLVTLLGNSLVNAFNHKREAVEAARKKTDEAAESIRKLNAAKLDSIEAEYDRIRDAADRASDAASRLMAAQDKLRGAKERAALAEIDAREKAELADLGADDDTPANRKAIATRYERERVETRADYAAQAAESEVGAAKAEVARLEAREAINARELAKKQAELDRMEAAYRATGEEARGQDPAKYGSTLKAQRLSIAATRKSIRETEEANAADASMLPAARIRLKAAQIGLSATDTESAAARSVVRDQERMPERDYARQAAMEEQLRAKQDEARAQQDRLAGLGAAARRESGEYNAANRALTDAERDVAGRNIGPRARDRALAPFREAAGREEAEARTANAAFASAKNELGTLLKALTDDIKRLESEVKQARSRAGRAAVDVEAGT